jgi:hypothetical protein
VVHVKGLLLKAVPSYLDTIVFKAMTTAGVPSSFIRLVVAAYQCGSESYLQN